MRSSLRCKPLVLVKICHTTGWKGKNGVEQAKLQDQSGDTFQLCQNKYLLNVFKKDVAEQMRIYMMFHIKKAFASFGSCIYAATQTDEHIPTLPSMSEGQ